MSDDKKWEEFVRCKQNAAGGFYACVDGAGVWFDSAADFQTAIHWCVAACGQFGLSTEEELRFFNLTPKQRGMSVIHSDILRKMWEAGLIS
jgi:hypothetical protein